MPKSLLKFAAQIGFTITPAQADKLVAYARCVWEKKGLLNLTSAPTFDEVLSRHICDGLIAAWQVDKLGLRAAQLADVGAGCGYIGLTMAVALPQAHVTLVESLEKRCKFINWAAMQTGICNISVKQVRLGQGTNFAFDLLTQRAMGPLPDIAAICLGAVRAGGIFLAFQGEHPQTALVNTSLGEYMQDVAYQLPCDNKTRHLVLFKKNHA